MAKEFKTLSEKMSKDDEVIEDGGYVFTQKDIKEFIKVLKERIKKYYRKDTNILHMSFDLFCLELKQLAGPKLIENVQELEDENSGVRK